MAGNGGGFGQLDRPLGDAEISNAPTSKGVARAVCGVRQGNGVKETEVRGNGGVRGWIWSIGQTSSGRQGTQGMGGRRRRWRGKWRGTGVVLVN